MTTEQLLQGLALYLKAYEGLSTEHVSAFLMGIQAAREHPEWAEYIGSLLMAGNTGPDLSGGLASLVRAFPVEVS
jgi:hypothetical protein